MALIKITDSIALLDSELQESFVRSGGPGGQNVNKTASAVQLRFDVRQSPNLPERVREIILNSGDSRLTKDGVFIIFADRHRTQELNRKDAHNRLFEVIQKADFVPKKRIATRPTLGSKKRRLDSKTKRGTLKKGRRGPVDMD